MYVLAAVHDDESEGSRPSQTLATCDAREGGLAHVGTHSPYCCHASVGRPRRGRRGRSRRRGRSPSRRLVHNRSLLPLSLSGNKHKERPALASPCNLVRKKAFPLPLPRQALTRPCSRCYVSRTRCTKHPKNTHERIGGDGKQKGVCARKKKRKKK